MDKEFGSPLVSSMMNVIQADDRELIIHFPGPHATLGGFITETVDLIALDRVYTVSFIQSV